MINFEYPKHAFQSTGYMSGIGLRDLFAGMAMQTLLRDAQTRRAMDAIPRDAYMIADAMLEARKIENDL